MTYSFTPTRMWSVGGDVCVGTGPLMSSWWTCHLVLSSLWERRLYCLVKWNMHIPFDLTKVNTHVYIPGKNVQFLQETRLRMFITILVVIEKKTKTNLKPISGSQNRTTKRNCGMFTQRIIQQWKMKKRQLRLATWIYLKSLIFNLKKQVAKDFLQ